MAVTSATRLCVTVQADSMAELCRQRDLASGADLVELRLDGVSDVDVAGCLAGRRSPVVVTCRPTWEGGRFAGSEEERLSLLKRALALGSEYVDVEWRADHRPLLDEFGGARIVLSMHDFTGMPADLSDRLRAMLGTQAAIVKCAVDAHCLADAVRLLQIVTETDAPGRVVPIAMGECGLVSRICASRFGAAWTYAGRLSNVGQVDARTLVETYRFRSIGPTTDIYGIAGRPIGHSISPAMHNAAFAEARRDSVYLPLPARDLDDLVDFMRGFHVTGASVTIPFKVSIIARLDEVIGAARSIGAVNTVRVDGGRWVGMNSDVTGFIAPLRRRAVRLRTRASVLGAGGSARAVVAGLTDAGASVTVHARKRETAARLTETWPVTVGEWPPAPGSWDLLVNCTPVGMHPAVDASPVPATCLTGGLVYDLVYNPAETRLLREAARAGCDVIGGLEMLVAQAEEQSEWWTGVRPAPGVMHQAAAIRLQEFTAACD